MPQESGQKRIERRDPPRVHISYDVEVNGATEKRALPLVVGVLSDIAGITRRKKLKERDFIEINRENFDEVMANMSPALSYRVDNTLSPDADARLNVNVKFTSIGGFDPYAVAKQIPELAKLLAIREKLSNLKSAICGNEELEAALQGAMRDVQKLKDLIGGPEAVRQAAGQDGRK